MKLHQALAIAAEKLAGHKDIDAPAFEAEILLRHSLNLSRAALHLNLNQELSGEYSAHFFELVKRRLQDEPTSYIIRRREFYGLDFLVDQRVLIPRPETEMLVEESLNLVRRYPVHSVADIGTGSGIIAVSLAVKLYRPLLSVTNNEESAAADIQIYATDISIEALEVARLNAQKHSVENRITFLQGDLMEPLPPGVDLVIANLPYVSSAEVAAMPSARFEPRLALDGGTAGLDQIYRLAEGLKGRVNPGGCVLLEIGMGQAEAVTDYLKHLYPPAIIELLKDLAGIDRVVKLTLR